MTNVPMTTAFAGLCAITLLAFRLAPEPQNPTKPSEGQRHTGRIGEWWVAAPGRVQFQVIGSGSQDKDSKQPDLWFETPADKDSNTLFENLVLEVIMHAATKDLPVSVEAKNSSGDDGSVAARAFDIVRIGISRG